jgi:hypothetical protein
MSLQYCNKSKSQLTSPTPAQAASCCVINGTYSIYGWLYELAGKHSYKFLSTHSLQYPIIWKYT